MFIGVTCHTASWHHIVGRKLLVWQHGCDLAWQQWSPGHCRRHFQTLTSALAVIKTHTTSHITDWTMACAGYTPQVMLWPTPRLISLIGRWLVLATLYRWCCGLTEHWNSCRKDKWRQFWSYIVMMSSLDGCCMKWWHSCVKLHVVVELDWDQFSDVKL